MFAFHTAFQVLCTRQTVPPQNCTAAKELPPLTSHGYSLPSFRHASLRLAFALSIAVQRGTHELLTAFHLDAANR
jgi:hypothetical protein